MRKVARRDFLKAAPAAAGVAAVAARAAAAASQNNGAGTREVRISSVEYTPVPDYPIRAQRYSDVRLADTFWKPKIATNAAVTIPFQAARVADSGHGLSGNVLEAAILSLKTHPDPELQAQVDARIREIKEARPRGNSGFEVAATYYHTTGRRDLLEQAIGTADALYNDFVVNNPPFSGGERDATNCVQLYRATHDKKHLDLAKHYLDIRGLPTAFELAPGESACVPFRITGGSWRTGGDPLFFARYRWSRGPGRASGSPSGSSPKISSTAISGNSPAGT